LRLKVVIPQEGTDRAGGEDITHVLLEVVGAAGVVGLYHLSLEGISGMVYRDGSETGFDDLTERSLPFVLDLVDGDLDRVGFDRL